MSTSAPEPTPRGARVPLLSVSGLSAWYGELQALYDIDLEVLEGEVLAVIGANGAGKSTLLKAIVGMMNRGAAAGLRGEIEFRGRRLERMNTAAIVDAGVTLVPEGRRLFARLSVQDNLLVGAYLQRCRDGLEARLEEIFTLFPRLRERREQPVATLSGGEQQMVAIGRALISSPRLILFDELSLGLAPKVVDDIYRRVRTINQQGTTCVIVEQDMSRALAVSDHVCVLLEGRKVLEGRPQTLSKDQVSAAYFGSRPDDSGHG